MDHGGIAEASLATFHVLDMCRVALLGGIEQRVEVPICLVGIVQCSIRRNVRLTENKKIQSQAETFMVEGC